MKKFRTSPRSLLGSLYRNRQLLLDLSWREITSRYKGSVFGILWSMLTPILMLGIYTFIFSEVFQSRWPTLNEGSRSSFALILFSGLIAFNFFSECVGRSPHIICSNPNFVKKVIFPLEILPCVTILSTLFHAMIGLAILFVFELIAFGSIPVTALLLPIAFAPLIFLTLGLTWFLSALGVYLRDIGQTIGIILTGLLFISPIFFPMSSFPERWRGLASLNPLALPIEQIRNVLIFSRGIDTNYLLYYMTASLAIAWLGYAVFQASRKGFADVL
ncbi:ABC transporter permease [Pseudomonas nitroreducens]|uniref:ABC transporter permease n=1 Tax=Pseudomonas nitroreducens TaxID=46680 RepID=UPI0028AA346B|nr:ABC transporter permease [Pseudomonas nitroreducens]